MYRIDVNAKLQEGILDPQGAAIMKSLHRLGFNEVKDIRVSKLFEIYFDSKDAYSHGRVKEMCDKLLVNEVIEDYVITEWDDEE